MAIARHSNLGMMNLSYHTILAIHNKSKKASSLDTHGPLALLQKAILERKPVTLFYSTGSGLTSEGPAGTTFAMQRILGLSQSNILKDGETPIIQNVIFPQPLTHFTDAPMSKYCKEPEHNSPKYEMESTGAAHLLAQNHTNSKWSHTFISHTESVGLDGELQCEDPHRANYTFTAMEKLRHNPGHHQHCVPIKCKLSKMMTWPAKGRSYSNKALSLEILGEYSNALHHDIATRTVNYRCK